MKEKNKKRSWKQIVSILSCIVVFCTTYALILPAVTLSTDTFCGKEEHTHNADCYIEQDKSKPLCGLEEGEGSEGHTHTEDCYGNVEVGRNLICGMEEVEGHVHDDSCYQSEFEYGLICGKEESEPTEGHVHNDDCYMSETPICGKEEHKHIHECYSNKEDVEDPKDWEEAYKDINKEEDAKTRILTVAKNEVGYKENEANFSVDEKDEEHYYTRYGHLYEDMYGDWNNYFTGYVLKYANVKMNFDKDISKWQNKTIDDQKEEGEEGNVVFFRDDEGELRSGIVTKVDDLTKDIRVIEGDVDGEVKEERINRDKVIAYLSDEVTIEDEDTPLAGDGVEKDDEEPASEKSVDVDGKDQVVEVGDQITLTATSNNIEEDKIVNYQWQYNVAEDCADDAWTDLEGETNKELVLDITEENINYFWRVNVSVDESGNQDGSVPAGVMPKFKLNLVYNEDENPVSDATDENDDFNSSDSEGTIEPEETVATETVATYSSVPFLLGARAATPTSTTTTTKDPIFLIQKTWSKEPADINKIDVSIRYNAKNYEIGSDGAPVIDEGFQDENKSLKTVALQYNHIKTNSWKTEIPYSEIEELVKKEYPEVEFDPDKVYISEDNVPGNYVPSYTKETKTRSETVSTKYVLASNQASATAFESGKKYIIKSVTYNTALDADLNAQSITYDTAIDESLIWTAENSDNFYGLKNSKNGYLNIKDNEVENDSDIKPVYINDTLCREKDGKTRNLIYRDGVFTSQKNGLGDSGYAVLAYEVTEEITQSQIIEYVRTVKNTKVSSGVFGESNGTSNGKEIPHSKSIDYLGDSGGNTDANYTDTDLSDKYRLYLDAGPIADENPIELILVLDTSGSMRYKLDNNEDASIGSRRWDYLTEALTGWKRSGDNSWSGADGGILKDFFKANTQNKVKIITFAQKADVKFQYYKDISGVKNALYLTPSGGTNYEDALVKLSNELNKVTRGYTPYVIFISDGEPTYHNNSSGDDEQGGGNYTNTKDAEHTIDAINKLYAAHSINGEPTFSLSTIYFGKDKVNDKDAPAKVFLSGGTWTYDNKTHTIPRLPTSDGFFVSTNDKTELQESLRLMSLGPRCKSLVISDTLSEDVELDKNTQVVVKAIPIANGSLDYSAATEIYKTATVYDQNGNLITGKLANSVAEFSFDNKDTLSTNNNETKWTNSTVFGDGGGVYIINNNEKITLELKFKDNWFMDSNYRYEIGFNVKVPETTYKKYADSGYGNVKGSLNSDYLRFGNTTSTNQPGFYSNDSSKLSYTYQNFYDETETLALSTGIQDPNDPGYLQAYQKPVVQAEARLLNLIKYSDDGETPLPDAEFTLYKAVKDGETNYDTVPGTTIKVEKTSVNKSSGSDGQIEFGRLSKNQTYYLKETTPPNGYLYPDYAAIKVVFNGEGTTVALVDSEGNELTGDKYTPGKDSCQVKVEKITSHITLKVNNTPGQELPNTGGAGTKLFTFSGAAVIAASGLMYGYKKKKDKRNGKGGLRK